MFAMEEDSEVLSERFAVRSYCSLEETLLNLLRQRAPALSNCIGQRVRYFGIEIVG